MVLQLRSPTPRSPEFPPRREGLSFGSVFAALATAFDETRRYEKSPARWQPGSADIAGLTRADIEALIPFVGGRKPLLVRVNKAAHIEEVLRFAQQQRLRIILLGAQEGWLVAKQLAAAKVPVILDPTMTLPVTLDVLASRPDNAALLAAAGVSIALTGPSHVHRVREIRTNAGTAVANGLPFDQALAALTINPARMFDCADRFGSLEPGKDADVVVWSGDPLQPLSWPVAVFIRGEQQSFDSRLQLLRDRYKQRAAR
jgi:imidazolonepropionase-like amidohydrolase